MRASLAGFFERSDRTYKTYKKPKRSCMQAEVGGAVSLRAGTHASGEKNDKTKGTRTIRDDLPTSKL